MRVFRSFNSKDGFNLIEAAIVLGIVGLVVGGIWAAASAAYENMRQQTASKNVLAFAQAIKNFYANSGVTTIATAEATLINMGVVPKDMVSGTNRINHPWTNHQNSIVNLTSANSLFTISFWGVPTTSCSALVSRNGNSSSGLIAAISVDGTNVTNYSNPTQCTSGSAGTKRVGFIFSIQG